MLSDRSLFNRHPRLICLVCQARTPATTQHPVFVVWDHQEMWQTLPRNSTQQDIRGNLMSPREICTNRYLHPAGALIITSALLLHNLAAAARKRALYLQYTNSATSYIRQGGVIAC